MSNQTNKVWDDERIAELKKLYDADTSYSEMRAHFGIAGSTLYQALARYYPERRIRAGRIVTQQHIDKIKHGYSEGLSHEKIGALVGLSPSTIGFQISLYKKSDPDGYAALRAKRSAKLNERGLDFNGRPKCWVKPKKSLADSTNKHGAYTDLDRAIDFLRKWTGVWKEKHTGKVVYGNTRKTSEEIIALAKRKGLVLDGESV